MRGWTDDKNKIHRQMYSLSVVCVGVDRLQLTVSSELFIQQRHTHTLLTCCNSAHFNRSIRCLRTVFLFYIDSSWISWFAIRMKSLQTHDTRITNRHMQTKGRAGWRQIFDSLSNKQTNISLMMKMKRFALLIHFDIFFLFFFFFPDPYIFIQFIITLSENVSN